MRRGRGRRGAPVSGARHCSHGTGRRDAEPAGAPARLDGIDRWQSNPTITGMPAWALQSRLQAPGASSHSLRAPCRALPPQQHRRSPSMLPWLLHLSSWLRGGPAGAAANGAVAPAALSSAEQAAVEAAAAAKPDAEHLIVMVHGLFGTRDNWRAIRQLLEEHLDRRGTALFVSHCNERHKVWGGSRGRAPGGEFDFQSTRPSYPQTVPLQQVFRTSPCPPHFHDTSTEPTALQTFDGIDTCGERLADEIRAVAAQHPRLRRISFLAHSMGGLIR